MNARQLQRSSVPLWEHVAVTVDTDSMDCAAESAALNESLRVYEGKGWELVSALRATRGSYYVYFFKRLTSYEGSPT